MDTGKNLTTLPELRKPAFLKGCSQSGQPYRHLTKSVFSKFLSKTV